MSDDESAPSGRGRLRALSTAVPLAGLTSLYALRLFLLRLWPAPTADGVTGVLMLAGVVAFSWAIFRVLDAQDARIARQHAELARRYQAERRLRDQIEGAQQAAIAIASASTAPEVLQRLVDLARTMIPAQYAALGVLGPHDAIDAFYTAGLGDEERQHKGPPLGRGILDATLREGRSLRIDAIGRVAGRAGFPAGHPVMQSLLAVPIRLADRIVGNLYLADREGGGTFSAEDERLLSLLAGHAAVAIEQARLTEQVRLLAVSAERERIRISLQDGAIQALFAVSLDLEIALDELEAEPAAAGERIDRSIARVGKAMESIRRCILGKELPEADNQSPATATREEVRV